MTTAYRFDGDAMLMFGWVADAEFRIRSVNPALRDWMENQGHEELLSRIDSAAEEALSLESLLGGLLVDRTVGIDIQEQLHSMKVSIEAEKVGRERQTHIASFSDWRAEVVFNLKRRLAGVRAVRPGGFPLQVSNPGGKGAARQRVDLINVCLIDDHRDIVDGFQGQLQEAWMRVVPVVQRATRTGILSLLGRNMSHNIGSHALYHIETDIEQMLSGRPAETKKQAELLVEFFRYLRERTEYLAGLATEMPLSPTSREISRVLKEFEDNKILVQRICRSEGVRDIRIRYEENGKTLKPGEASLKAMFPTGAVGVQALYILLENILRDSAKYGRAMDTMQVIVSVTDHDEDLLKVQLWIPGSTEPEKAEDYQKTVRAAFIKVTIAEDSGEINTDHWGMKERFVAAAHLRGMNPAALVPGVDDDKAGTLAITPQSYTGPQLLDLKLIDDEPTWIFYLLKPRKILVLGRDLSDERIFAQADPANTLKDASWLDEDHERKEALRHQFVVLVEDEDQTAEKCESELTLRLPSSTFLVRRNSSKDSFGPFLPLPAEDLGKLSVPLLQRRYCESLLRKRGIPDWPVLVIADNHLPKEQTRRLIEDTMESEGITVRFRKGMEKAKSDKVAALVNERAPVVLFHRHKAAWFSSLVPGAKVPAFTFGQGPGEVLHFEPHESKDGIRDFVKAPSLDRLLEEPDPASAIKSLFYGLTLASLTRVLIVDERIYPDSVRKVHFSLPGSKSITRKTLFGWKGVEIFEITADQGETWSEDWQRLETELQTQHYDFVPIHLGVIDKVRQERGIAHDRVQEALIQELKAEARRGIGEGGGYHCPTFIVHTARMRSGLDERFLPYGNITNWLSFSYSKIGIVDELNRLRRVG